MKKLCLFILLLALTCCQSEKTIDPDNNGEGLSDNNKDLGNNDDSTVVDNDSFETDADHEYTNDEDVLNDNVDVDSEDVDSEDVDGEDVDGEDADNDSKIEPDYPENVSATCKKPGDIARNLEFKDSDNNDRQLGEWYKPNNHSSKIIWIAIHLYDCHFSISERKEIPSLNGKFADRGLKTILIMNGLLTGPQPAKEPDKVSRMKEEMINAEGEDADFTYGYFLMEHQNKFHKFINDGYPVNILIDSSTMKIIEHSEGWDYGASDRFEEYLNKALDK